MKKVQIILFITFLLFGLDSKAQEKKINNNLIINIPNNYRYLELSVSQLVTNFPELFPNEQIRNDLGIGMKSKIIFISNNYKTINFFRDITSPLGSKKIYRNHMEPILKITQDQEFQNKIINIVEKTNGTKNFLNLTPTEINLLMKDLFNNPQFIREIKIFIQPFVSKFQNEYNFDKFSILFIGDEEADILNDLNKKNLTDLERNFKKQLKDISQKNIDPSIKNLENWKFKISKNNNNNLYLYSNDIIYNELLYSGLKQELLLTSHENKIFLLTSFCYHGCVSGTDFSYIIKPTNLYSFLNLNKKKTINDTLSLMGFDGQPMNKRGYDPKDPSYDPYNNKSQTMENTNSKSNFINELNDLNKLYKSGALTKEEFEKAKKKNT